MSWRIEHANPFALVRELPDALVQTCFLRVPRDLPDPGLIALLRQLRRVARDDGTLWIASHSDGRTGPIAVAREAGWLLPCSVGSVGGREVRGAVTLLAKRPAFYFNPRPPLLGSVHRQRAHACDGGHPRLDRQLQRRAWCVPASARALPSEVIQWCIRASTSRWACEFCGAAWQRFAGARTAERRWIAGCEHRSARGRCLVLDPFCGLAEVGAIALALDRGFLGVQSDFDTALRAAARMVHASTGVPR